MSTAVTWVLHTDLVNICRGRGLPAYNPADEPRPAIGWVPADLALDAFGGLVDNLWGPMGDLRLSPDPATYVEVDVGPDDLPPFRFALATCTDLAGNEWDSCPRGILRRVVDELRDEFGLQFLAAFEHEFALIRPDAPVPFSVDAARRAEPLLTRIVTAMIEAGIGPENVLPEFGHNQIEVTHDPAVGVGAADRAVMAREIIREVARAAGQPITFAPVIGPGAGTNGAPHPLQPPRRRRSAGDRGQRLRHRATVGAGRPLRRRGDDPPPGPHRIGRPERGLLPPAQSPIVERGLCGLRGRQP